MKLFGYAAIAALTLGVATSAQAVTLVNGGFEQPGMFTGGFQQLNAGNTSLTGWSIDAGSIDLINTYWAPSLGSYSLDMSGSNAGTISQTVTGFTIGEQYEVSFDMGGNSFAGNVVKSLSASMGMAGGGTFLFDTTGTSFTSMGWETNSFVFTAGDTSGLLSFSSNENNAFGAALDNISIASVSAVPLPAGMVLMLSGIGGLAAVRRMRKN